MMPSKVCPLYQCAINERGYESCGDCAELPYGTFREMKDPEGCALRPQSHWTDQKLQVPASCCVVGYLLLKLLEQRGFAQSDVTDIILSHLHFDHAGGLLAAWQEDKESQLLFPNAKYYVSGQAWERATHPHPRDRASFVPALNQKIEASERLILLGKEDVITFDELTVRFFSGDGHTPGLLCPDLRWDEQRVVFPSVTIRGALNMVEKRKKKRTHNINTIGRKQRNSVDMYNAGFTEMYEKSEEDGWCYSDDDYNSIERQDEKIRGIRRRGM